MALFLTGASRAGARDEDLVVAVTEEKGVYSVFVRMGVPAPPSVVWAVLTDYDRMAEYTRDIEASRLVERHSDVQIVEQRGRGLLGISVWVRLRVVERPPETIEFEALDGDFRVYRGGFRVEPQGIGTQVTYTLTSQGKFWIPPWIGRPLIRGRVRRIFQDLRAEVLRRWQGVSPAGDARRSRECRKGLGSWPG